MPTEPLHIITGLNPRISRVERMAVVTMGSLPLWIARPPLGVHICDVVGVRPEPQVGGVHASRIVARVANILLPIQIALHHRIGDPVHNVPFSVRQSHRPV